MYFKNTFQLKWMLFNYLQICTYKTDKRNWPKKDRSLLKHHLETFNCLFIYYSLVEYESVHKNQTHVISKGLLWEVKTDDLPFFFQPLDCACSCRYIFKQVYYYVSYVL